MLIPIRDSNEYKPLRGQYRADIGGHILVKKKSGRKTKYCCASGIISETLLDLNII